MMLIRRDLGSVLLAACLSALAVNSLGESTLRGVHDHVAMKGLEDVPTFRNLLSKLEDVSNEDNADVHNEKRELFLSDFFDQVESIMAYIPYDTRFDSYSVSFAIANSLLTRTWTKPESTDVTVPEKQEDVPHVVCGLAEDIVVPETDEHEEDVHWIVELAQRQGAEHAPMAETADDGYHWYEGEDKIKTIEDRLFAGDFSNREYVKWGDDRDTDEGLKKLVFHGIGMHRVERVRAGDADADTPNGRAKYAVYLNDAAGLETKPGFARLGANAYFDRSGNVLSIVRGGKTFTPQGEQGSEPYEKCVNGPWYWPFPTCELVPAVIGYKHARMAFRGTLNAVITGIDHLHELHLVVGNSLVTANVEELGPDHPVRRIMTPFGFRTEAINYQASVALTNEFGLVHRAFPFNVQGQKDLYRYGSQTLKFKTVPEQYADQGIDPADMTLALHEDGLEFYGLLRDLTKAYLVQYYDLNDPASCASDDELGRWYSRINSMYPQHDLPPLNCDNLVEVLASTMYRVSAVHNHVGSIGAELRDPCFMPWSWREGELCGMPRTFYTQALTMGLTSLTMPKIVEDYTHILPKSDINDHLWHGFTSSLLEFGERVIKRNLKRVREFQTFLPFLVETGIGI